MAKEKVSISRRDFLTGAASAGLMLTASNSFAMSAKSGKTDTLGRPHKRTFRFANFTHIHLEPGKKRPPGIGRCPAARPGAFRQT